MRRWYLPLTVLGLSGVGVFLASDTGRDLLRAALNRLQDGPQTLEEWNATAQRELDNIQARLDELAKTFGLGPAPAV